MIMRMLPRKQLIFVDITIKDFNWTHDGIINLMDVGKVGDKFKSRNLNRDVKDDEFGIMLFTLIVDPI